MKSFTKALPKRAQIVSNFKSTMTTALIASTTTTGPTFRQSSTHRKHSQTTRRKRFDNLNQWINPNLNLAKFKSSSKNYHDFIGSNDQESKGQVKLPPQSSFMNALKNAAVLSNKINGNDDNKPDLPDDYDKESYCGYNNHSPNLNSLMDQIRYCINEETKDGIDSAIQIVYQILENPSFYSNHCNTKNDENIETTTLLQYNSIAECIHLTLNAGKEKMISSPNHSDFINVALGLLQFIEMKIYRGQIDVTTKREKKQNNDYNTTYNQLLKTYNLVIDIISKSRNEDGILLIQDILERMKNAPHQWDIAPDTITYNSLLYAYSRKRYTKAAQECEFLLQQMKQSQHENVQVDTISYNIVLNAWARSSDKASTTRSERLLQEMQQEYLNGNTNVKPNYITFTILFEALSRSKEIDAAQRSTELLHTMVELYEMGDDTLQPNIMTYNAVLNTWSKSTLPGSSQRAQELLDEMIEKYQQHCCADNDNSGRTSRRKLVVQPDKVSFAICIKAYANDDSKGSSDKALSLLKQMIYFAQHHGYDTQPDIGTFNSVLRSLANDSNEEKAIKAENLLHQIEELNLCPDLTTYNNTLRCCCTTRTSNERLNRSAVRIASDVLLKLRQLSRRDQSGQNVTTTLPSTDPYTFNFFIKTCDRLCEDEEKLKLIQAAFQFCIEEGMLNRNVLGILKNSLSPKDLRNLLGVDDCRNIKLRHLPKSWRCNFQQQYERHHE